MTAKTKKPRDLFPIAKPRALRLAYLQQVKYDANELRSRIGGEMESLDNAIGAITDGREPTLREKADVNFLRAEAVRRAESIDRHVRSALFSSTEERSEYVGNPGRSKSRAFKVANDEVIAATAARKVAEREALEAEPAIAEAVRRYMAGDTTAGEEVRKTSADISEKRRAYGAALERERLAIHRRQRAMMIGNPREPEKKTAELVALEKKWLAAKRTLQKCYEEEAAAADKYAAAEEWEAKRDAHDALYSVRLRTHDATTAFLKLDHELTRYHFDSDPPRKRRGKATANPAPIPKLALLGEAIEIETIANGKRQIIRPAGAVLLVSADAKTIVIARPKSSTPTNAPTGSAGARRMFEKWSQFKSDRAVRLVIGDKPLSHNLGNVEAIRYRSDKWTGRPTLYEHKFEKPATAIADSPRAPSVIRIDGDPRRVLVNERGIVG